MSRTDKDRGWRYKTCRCEGCRGITKAKWTWANFTPKKKVIKEELKELE